MSDITKQWIAQIYIDEHDGSMTQARVQLRTRDTELVGHGSARRNRVDADVPEIGDELAVARAFADIAHQLLNAAAADIEAITHEPVTRLEV